MLVQAEEELSQVLLPLLLLLFSSECPSSPLPQCEEWVRVHPSSSSLHLAHLLPGDGYRDALLLAWEGQGSREEGRARLAQLCRSLDIL